MCGSNPHIYNINVEFKAAYFGSLFTVQIPSALLVQKCTDLNRTLRPKVYGSNPHTFGLNVRFKYVHFWTKSADGIWTVNKDPKYANLNCTLILKMCGFEPHIRANIYFNVRISLKIYDSGLTWACTDLYGFLKIWCTDLASACMDMCGFKKKSL